MDIKLATRDTANWPIIQFWEYHTILVLRQLLCRRNEAEATIYHTQKINYMLSSHKASSFTLQLADLS